MNSRLRGLGVASALVLGLSASTARADIIQPSPYADLQGAGVLAALLILIGMFIYTVKPSRKP